MDHFNTSNADTFKHRYFCNTGYANGSSIYILHLESFGTANFTRVSDPTQPHVVNARELGATVCSLEHRFYGNSTPSSSSNTLSDMALLTSEQAVEDISTVITALNTKFNETAAKWVLVGAGYGGSLALWHRMLHPDMTVGAVGSGSAISPAADFYLYQKNVEDVYRAYVPACYTNLANGMTDVRHAVQSTKGRKGLSKSLKLQPAFSKLDLNYNDIEFFYAVLASTFAIPVKNNRVSSGVYATSAGVADVCSVLNDASTANGRGGEDCERSAVRGGHTEWRQLRRAAQQLRHCGESVEDGRRK